MKGHIAKKGSKYYIVIDLDRDEVTGKRKQKWLSGYEKKENTLRSSRNASDIVPLMLP